MLQKPELLSRGEQALADAQAELEAILDLQATTEFSAFVTSSEALEALIRKLIRGKIDDGQLNETPMTMEDIEKVTQAFLTVLSGVFHQRVEYPEMKLPPKKEHRAVEASKAEAGEEAKHA